jgi:hypothetical protein
MISPDDLVHLAYAADLTDAGVLHARRILRHLPASTSAGLYGTLRRCVAATAAQLAFRRFLTADGIPFSVSPPPFTDPDRYDLELGIGRCELKAFLISHPSQIAALESNPAVVLSAPALVPVERHAAETPQGGQFYMFAFVSGTVSQGGVPIALAERKGLFCMHAMPLLWRRPKTWAPLGELFISSKSARPIRIELAGEDRSGEYAQLSVDIPPGHRMSVSADMYSLSHVCISGPLTDGIEIRASARRLVHAIRPGDWHDISIQGREISLLGWMRRELFRSKARLIHAGSRVFQFDRTRAENLAVDVAQLYPVQTLLEAAREAARQ